MGITTRTIDEVTALSVAALGLDHELFLLEYQEAICASLRRAASFLCPTTPRTLVDAVREALEGIVTELPSRDDLMGWLDQMISGGDLIELADPTHGHASRLLFLGPPSFVEKEPGRYLIAGTRPYGAALVPPDIAVEYEGHARTAVLDHAEAEARLREAGLHRVSISQWLGRPAAMTAREYLIEFERRLDVAMAAGFVDGLTIIDPDTSNTYYRGRWRSPAAGDGGDFVGRRPQAYGADLWCVVRLHDGAPDRLLDLPVDTAAGPGRDDAWRIQAAIDAERQTPPTYRVQPIPGSTPANENILDFFAPLPTWAERYLELSGISVERSTGALFSYRIPTSSLAPIESVLSDTLWINRTDGTSA
jgi:hypothetical protein